MVYLKILKTSFWLQKNDSKNYECDNTYGKREPHSKAALIILLIIQQIMYIITSFIDRSIHKIFGKLDNKVETNNLITIEWRVY